MKSRKHRQSRVTQLALKSADKPAPAKMRPAQTELNSRIFLFLPVAAIAMLLGWWLFRSGSTIEQPRQEAAKNVPSPATSSGAATNSDASIRNVTARMAANAATNLNPIAEANQLMQLKKYDEAIAIYEQAVSQHGEDEDIHYNLGIAYARKGNVEAAIKHYEEALRILPDYAEAHNNLGNLLASRRRFDEASGHFQTALKISPDYASAHNNFGTALRLQGKTNEAREHFAEAVRLSPEYGEAHFNYGTILLSAGQYEEAVKQLSEAVRLKPDFKPAEDALARARELWIPGPVKPGE
ncbi:MAG: tetratricopeptide repeat protein [Verrucomicrobia bacterium]|nr:tetratricopeptide repeat protein [Verrucomicrobiota bacterium]